MSHAPVSGEQGSGTVYDQCPALASIATSRVKVYSLIRNHTSQAAYQAYATPDIMSSLHTVLPNNLHSAKNIHFVLTDIKAF